MIKKIFNRAINGIYILIIILLLSYFGFRYSGKIEIYNVETGSMEEDIHRGDYILIYKANNYKIGDVVTFKVNDYFVTHRIIKMDDEYVTTKGDANNTEDAKIDKSTIVGKVISAGGILNIIIEYKFAIVSFLLGLYLLSCYFGNDDENSEAQESDMEELEDPGEPIEENEKIDDKNENSNYSESESEENIEMVEHEESKLEEEPEKKETKNKKKNSKKRK